MKNIFLSEGCRRKLAVCSGIALLVTLFGCSNSAGSGSQTPPAPSALTYPQAAINATMGQAITIDTPTVTGTVSSYSISPSLPAGLSLNTSTGVISGTPAAVASQAFYTVTATNAAGSTSTAVQIVVNAPVIPPSNLLYPQTTITSTVGQAIVADTPTVTGTVTSYTVAPALPAGLSLNNSTGSISGTPTAIAAQASYTVTATNSAGSTTAVLQIVVNAAVAAPSNLSYPQAITGTVGKLITPDIPWSVGTPTSYVITPSLPAGLSLNLTTGVISGIPTAIAAQANYTVTASNAGGSTTTTVTIVVGKATSVLVDLGHADQINQIFTDSTHMLTQDMTGQWAFWDLASDTKLVSGDQQFHGPVGAHQSVFQWPLSLAGPTFAIGVPNGVEVYSSVDGHALSIIPSTMIDSIFSTTWWKLASDGSYICAGSSDGISAWTPSGQLLFARQGDYSAANAFAAPGQIQVALGPAGQSVIETISASTGTSAVSPAFSGAFNTWFTDGTKFLTNVANTVYTYSSQGAQQAIVALPGITNLTGQGNWIWSIVGHQLSIYPIGASSPAATFPEDYAVPSGTTIGIVFGETSLSVIDLSVATPVETSYTLPAAVETPTAYAATSASQWLAGNRFGVLLDGASLSNSPNAPRYLDLGAAWSIAGGSGRTAVATASGTIYYFDPAISIPVGTINFSSSKVALSSDGTVLAASANSIDLVSFDRSLNIYSLPGGNLINSTPYQANAANVPYLVDFSLSASGTVIGQLLYTVTPKTNFVTRQVGPTTGGPAIWSDSPLGISFNEAIQLSPDGTLIAVATAPRGSGTGSNIYKNGNLAAAVPGWVVGWIDNGHILVNSYAPFTNDFSAASIYDSTGALISTTPLPELPRLLPVTSSSVYSPDLNTIFSLSTGAATWTTVNKSRAVGAVAGSYVVFASDTRVLVDTY